MPKLPFYILLLITLIFSSCQPNKISNKDTWLVGKIDNPRLEYVILKHNRTLIDTVSLDSDNFFRYKFNTPVTEGMYSFEHDESFPFYIAQGDSLIFLSNTLDFEASLYFSNDHSAENNLLLVLNNRLKNDNYFWSELQNLTTEEFNEELKTRRKENNRLLNNFLKDNPNATKRFIRIAEGVIEQNESLNKERYIQIQLAEKPNSHDIPESFYSHRKNINLQKDTMEVYYPYYRLIHTYLDNKALDSFNRKEEFNRSDFELNKYRLNLIDSLIINKNIKNYLLYSSTRSFLLNAKNAHEESEFLELHNKLSSCPINRSSLKDLSNYTLEIKPGKKVPNIKLLTSNNTEVDLLDIIKRPSILYFWSSKNIKHQKNIHTRASELNAKFPEYQFIGINTDDHFKNWRSEIKKLGYDEENEFQLYNPKKAEKELVITSYYKVLILNENGIIRNGHTNIYHRTIENELLEYLN